MSPGADRRTIAVWARNALLGAALGIAVLCGSGCSSVNWMGDGFHDEFAHWGENLRPAGQPGNLAGVSEQSQEVERDLGVR